jgi:flavin reductase (DIM6/NTAB) family NADH-FMN oxidoreductase RutF
MPISGEVLKQVMRHWPSGIAVVSSVYQGVFHGLTANSFTSVSISPPIVSVTINNHTRSYQMITDAGVFGITFLSEAQADISERFAGRTAETNRFSGLDIFTLTSGVPLIYGGLAHLDCRVVYCYGMPDSALFLGEVVSAQITDTLKPLVYYNREYHKL